MLNELIYYFSLFLIIFGSRFVKVRKEKTEKSWLEYFLFAEEILYTAAGIVILLLDKLAGSKEGVFGIYFVLVAITAGINSLTGDENKQIKGYFNFAVVIIALFMTFGTFVWILPDANSKAINDKTNINKMDSTYIYKIAIPYTDNTLIKHIGKQKFYERQLVYFTNFECKNDSTAMEIALKKFYNDNYITSPLFPIQNSKSTEDIIVNEEDILIVKEFIMK